MEYPDLKEIERRPRQYWNADGLPDLTVGSLWIIWGAAFILPEVLPQGSWLRYYWMVVPLLLIGGGFAANWATKMFKRRLTFPRTGYVEWPEPGMLQWIVPALLGAGVAAVIWVLARRIGPGSLEALISPGVALLLALGFLCASVRQRLPHYLWSSAASLALALVFARMGPSLEHGLVCLFLALGALSLLLGTLRLRSFLRRNPVSQEGGA